MTPELPDVSVVICTYDRPEPLTRLLQSIQRQESPPSHEIIVVDNHPSTGSTEGLKATYPDVRWVAEPRRGLSFARNAGIRAARSGVVVFADDDMEVLPGWLQALTSPVLTQDFDVVVGPVVPSRLENDVERLFEAYGGHGHQRVTARFDAAWLKSFRWSLPLWEIGILGNAAMRRDVFEESKAGFFEEALGVGAPAGSSEDLYLLYRLLRAEGGILREPAATARHAHRDTMRTLSRQLCGYRRGEVCFCLLALLRHGDVRGLLHLGWRIPAWRTRLFLEEVGRRLRGQRLFPFGLMLRELAAYLSGPFALAISLRRARRLRDHFAANGAE